MLLAITPFEKSEAALLRSTESVDESVRGHSWTEVYLTPAGLYVVGTCSRGHNGYYSVVPSYRAKQILAAADTDVFAEDEGLEVMFPAPGAPLGVEVKAKVRRCLAS